jgi:hypothetical protein
MQYIIGADPIPNIGKRLLAVLVSVWRFYLWQGGMTAHKKQQ